MAIPIHWWLGCGCLLVNSFRWLALSSSDVIGLEGNLDWTGVDGKWLDWIWVSRRFGLDWIDWQPAPGAPMV